VHVVAFVPVAGPDASPEALEAIEEAQRAAEEADRVRAEAEERAARESVAAVRTAGFETDLCLAGSEHPGLPAPGTIISGTVVLSAAIDAPLPDGGRA